MKSIMYPLVISLLFVIIVFISFDSLESQFTHILNNLEQYKWQYALGSFFILASDILLPVPSSIVMYMNGYVLGIIEGSLLSMVSLLLGSVIGYYLGKLTSMGLKASQEEPAKLFMQKYGALAILISRGIPILSESISVVCGYNKIPFKQYFIFNVIGYSPLCLLYAICGNIGYDKNTFLLSFGFSLLISAAFYFFGKKIFLKPENVKVN
jgi:uncharacterized membrane protein YdjX (TVP38/TMEM64 family)